MNTNNFRLLATTIDMNADRFEMDAWFYWSECGTRACIAGWAASLAKAVDPANFDLSEDVSKLAREWLDISYSEGNLLFYADRWPEPYGSLYLTAATKAGQAYIAADMLEAIADGSISLNE